MRVDLRRFRIERAASKDHRPVIAQPFFDAKSSSLVATNSYVLAIVPVELEDGDESGPVPVAAIEEARKRTRGKVSTSQLSLNGRAEVAGGDASFARPDLAGSFPDWKKLIKKPKDEPAAVFAINPKLLYDLALALGAGRGDAPVTIEVYSALKPIFVSAGNGAHGILMPVRISGGRP